MSHGRFFIAAMRTPGSGKLAQFYNVDTWFRAMACLDTYARLRSYSTVTVYDSARLDATGHASIVRQITGGYALA